MCQLSSALDYIHCDIKPQNVLVDAQLHTTKLADVSVARPLNTASGQIQTTPIMLSPLFIAPEVNDGEYGFPADIFSFGMLLHVLQKGAIVVK
jgi:serine/threonine protein kinase